MDIITAVVTLSAAALGAFLFWAFTRFDKWWDRPILEVDVGDGDRFSSLNPILNRETGERIGQGIFARVMVTNRGNRTAKKCSAFLTKVEEWSGDLIDHFRPTTPVEYADYLPLVWSHNPGQRGMDLMPGPTLFLDVVSSYEGKDVFFLQTDPPPARYQGGFGNTTFYRMTVQVSADDATPVTAHFYLHWNGNWRNCRFWSEKGWRSFYEDKLKPTGTTTLRAR